MKERILFVDDEQNVLDGIRRQLRKTFDELDFALGGVEGLRMVAEKGPFAVVVSDMRMPEMDGVAFLGRVREASPDTVRMILSGQADLSATIAAINDTGIFRFLTKPCSPETMTRGLEDALAQYRLVVAEKELLEKTLSGSVQVLADVLGLANPRAFSRASRIREYTETMAQSLGLEGIWELRIAAMLSQIGCVTLPDHVLTRVEADEPLKDVEREMFRQHPAVARQLLAKIPRLERVAEMISRQFESPDGRADDDPRVWDPVEAGARMLRVAGDYETLRARGMDANRALQELRRPERGLPGRLVAALEEGEKAESALVPAELSVDALQPGMHLTGDVRTKGGVLLAREGQAVTESMLARLRNFASGAGVREPIHVLAPAGPGVAASAG